MKMKAVITGPMVQWVGYRVFLMHQAIIEGIERFSALNVSDNALVVLAEADRAARQHRSIIGRRSPAPRGSWR